MENAVHPFEAANLGKAPFRFVAAREITFQAHPGAPVVAGGSCDYCGTAIRYACIISDITGHTFKVGTDCVHKTCAKGGPIASAADRAEKKLKKQIAASRLAARIAAAKESLQNASLLTDAPHSHPTFAARGKTRRDEVLFLLNAGARGRTTACRIIEDALGA